MDWLIESSDVGYRANNGKGYNQTLPFAKQKVLYRYDNFEPLSVVS